ncbi:MAG TPA: hypothetical protein VJ715_06595 [Pyrinomonadaceae bacterium]|nr:hypothetical protein [Pyrinomonadaceae bacterium]
MKRCSVCQRVYDDTMAFCLEDGSALTADSSATGDMAATVIMPDPRVTAPPPTWPETVHQPLPPRPQPYAQPQPTWPPPALAPQTYPSSAARQGRGMAVTSLVLAISAFALLGFCIIAGATGVDSEVIGGIFIISALGALVGAILGIVAASKASRDTSPQNSKAMAVVALVLNSFYLLLTVIFLILGAVASSS